ncbi:MAG: ATP-dependent nuclease [Candidatus Sifarchaeia archaeon]
MRIKSIKVENFRCIKLEEVFLDNYTCLVGPNGTGKSTILTALNIFFRNKNSAPTNVQQLDEEDFNHKNVNEPARITLTFVDLNDEAQEEFKAYFRQNELNIFAEAVWNKETRLAEVKHYGLRRVVKDFSSYFKAIDEKEKVSELKIIYTGMRKIYPELPTPGTKDQMTMALREYEEKHPEKCDLLPSEDQFYGWSKGANKLEKYIQWVYIPAVKEASSEQEETKSSALGLLLERTVRRKIDFNEEIKNLYEETVTKYEDILDSKSDVLNSISSNLQTRLREWSHSRSALKLRWSYDPMKSLIINEPLAKVDVGEDEFLGDLSRLGHGLQRSFLLAILQELAQGEDQENVPSLVLGFEEPELYQHPPQARHIRNVLETLSDKNNQVIITTHSPYFISSNGFENVRRFIKCRKTNNANITQTTYEELSQKLAVALDEKPIKPSSMMAKVDQIMQPSLNELYFSSVAILVEGVEDVAFISTHLLISELWTEFHGLGCHFIICEGKSNLSRPLSIANALSIPVFALFDSDINNEDQQDKNERDNKCILSLCNAEDFDALSTNTLFGNNYVMWSPNLTKVIKNEIGEEKWLKKQDEVRKQLDLTDGINQKNSRLIAATLETLNKEGWRSENLNKTTKKILEFARRESTFKM